jgi:acetate kinase
MGILVFNTGSSTLKFRFYRVDVDGALQAVIRGAIDRLGERAAWTWQAGESASQGEVDARSHGAAAQWVLGRLRESSAPAVEAIGHRVVHGGDLFARPTLLVADVIAGIDSLRAVAPLHNPPALEVIRACREALGSALPMVAVFDTAFHATIPPAAHSYALPADWVRAHGIRRYGFHGLAHRSMYERFQSLHSATAAGNHVVTLQLGNGCSAAAIRDGVSIDTSMGYTPLEGLIMATRCGDVDPGAVVRLAAAGVNAAELDDRLNNESGLRALSGASGDMRTLLALEAKGHDGARLAIEAFCLRARKYLGAYLAALGGADAVLFGGGIGEHAPPIRERICGPMGWCGLQLDTRANAAAVGVERRISADGSKPVVYAISVDEEVLIARDTLALVASSRP